MLDWKVPPCISNWKNPKGYTIPLEMRLSADGRTLDQDVAVNERFSSFSDSLYMAEREARKELDERNKIQKSIAYKEYQRQEEDMRKSAAQAREEKNRILTE